MQIHAKSKVPAPKRLQLARKMEGSSFQMLLQKAYEKESSNYKMLQIVCKSLIACKMKGSSSKMLQRAWKIGTARNKNP